MIASLFIWLLITLSKEYRTSISLAVSYTNIPQNKLIQKEPIKEIDVLIKGSGFKIISAKFQKKSLKLNAALLTKKTASKYYFLLKNQQVHIQKQLLSGLQIEQLLKDTIYLELGHLVSKKIPVRPTLNIRYHIGYDASSPITIEPDSIIITGPEKQLKNITQLNSTALKLDDVKSDFENTITIVKPTNSSNIHFSQETIKIKGSVDKFTEGSIHTSFKTINLPANIQLTTLAKTVEIVFIVGLSDFNTITENSFQVECDYSIAQRNNVTYLVPKIISKSDLIKSAKIIPNKIDFLIHK